MSQVMIYPATYENVRMAVDRAFELFPLKVAGKKRSGQTQCAPGLRGRGGDCDPSRRASSRGGKIGNPGPGLHRGGGQSRSFQLRGQ